MTFLGQINYLNASNCLQTLSEVLAINRMYNYVREENLSRDTMKRAETWVETVTRGHESGSVSQS